MDMVRPQTKAWAGRQIRWPVKLRCGGRRERSQPILLTLDWQEKPRCERVWCPYRKPTLVDRDESPKVFERTLVKELGNLTP